MSWERTETKIQRFGQINQWLLKHNFNPDVVFCDRQSLAAPCEGELGQLKLLLRFFQIGIWFTHIVAW